VAHVDKFRGHFFAFASSWTKVAHADKFRGLFFAFASLWTKVTQGDKLKGRRCILLFFKPSYSIIKQCLSNKNENTVISKSKKIYELNKTYLMHSLKAAADCSPRGWGTVDFGRRTLFPIGHDNLPLAGDNIDYTPSAMKESIFRIV